MLTRKCRYSDMQEVGKYKYGRATCRGNPPNHAQVQGMQKGKLRHSGTHHSLQARPTGEHITFKII